MTWIVLLWNISYLRIVLLMCFYTYYCSTCILHGYLPADFMRLQLHLSLKVRLGTPVTKIFTDPIALVTAASKLFQICILEILETYPITHDHQNGFKASILQTCVFALIKLWLNIKCTLIKWPLFTHVCLIQVKLLIGLIIRHYP